MASESTQVGYRLRIQPPDLARYPDSAKLVWFGLVVKYGLRAKDKDLARGIDKNGAPLRPLSPRSIKYRRSEVGPVDKHAPPLIPAHALSRARSLLTGRPHLQSAEFWWGFDSHSGRSFAAILRYQRDEYGRDVFGLSPRGTAWTFARAMKDWDKWKAQGGAVQHPAKKPLEGFPLARFKTPIKKVKITGEIDLENFDLVPGADNEIRKAIAAKRFPGFRRLNMRGEQWKPFTPASTPPPAPAPKSKPLSSPAAPNRPKPGPVNLPLTDFIPASRITPRVDPDLVERLAQKAPRSAVSAVPVGLLRLKGDQIGPFQDLVNKRIAEFYRDHPTQNPIVVVYEDGKFYLHEGHHRAVGAIMRGDFSVPGLIIRRLPGTKDEAEILWMDQDGNFHVIKVA